MTPSTAPTNDLERRYVTALLDLSTSPDFPQAIGAVLTLIDSSSDLRAALSSPVIKLADQQRAVQQVLTAAQIPTVLQGFVGVVLNNRRGANLAAFLRAALAEIAARNGQTTATVQVAAPLNADQQKRLEQNLSTWTGRQVNLDQQITPAVLGGLKIRVGSVQIDDTVAGKLARLEQTLLGKNAA